MRELRLNRRDSETELSALLRSKNYSVQYTELPIFFVSESAPAWDS